MKILVRMDGGYEDGSEDSCKHGGGKDDESGDDFRYEDGGEDDSVEWLILSCSGGFALQLKTLRRNMFVESCSTVGIELGNT